MKITVSQQPIFRSHLENYACTLDVLEANKDTDWLLTPECAVSGYCLPPTLTQTFTARTQQVEDIILKIKDKAAEYKINLALGTGIKDTDQYPYNAMLVYNDEGKLISKYKKRILTRGWEGGGETHHYLPGYVPNYFWLDKEETILASSMICNDFWCMPRVAPDGNPYYHTELAKQGVDVLFVSSNCNGERDELAKVWNENHLQVFAREFAMYVVHAGSATTVNHEETDFLQCSTGIIGPDGEWIAKCKDTGMDSITVDLDIKPRRHVEKSSSHIFKREDDENSNS